MDAILLLALFAAAGALLGLTATLASHALRWFCEDWRAERRWLYTVSLRREALTFNSIVIKARNSREAMEKLEVGGLTWVLEWEDLPQLLQIHLRAVYALDRMFPRERTGIQPPPPPELYWEAPVSAPPEILDLVKRTRWKISKEA